jgi:hypothetical protein
VIVIAELVDEPNKPWSAPVPVLGDSAHEVALPTLVR